MDPVVHPRGNVDVVGPVGLYEPRWRAGHDEVPHAAFVERARVREEDASGVAQVELGGGEKKRGLAGSRNGAGWAGSRGAWQ